MLIPPSKKESKKKSGCKNLSVIEAELDCGTHLVMRHFTFRLTTANKMGVKDIFEYESNSLLPRCTLQI